MYTYNVKNIFSIIQETNENMEQPISLKCKSEGELFFSLFT